MIKEEEEATTEAAKEFQNKPSIKISFVGFPLFLLLPHVGSLDCLC